MAESAWAISRDKVAQTDRVPMMHSLIFLLTVLGNRASKERPPLTAARSSLFSWFVLIVLGCSLELRASVDVALEGAIVDIGAVIVEEGKHGLVH